MTTTSENVNEPVAVDETATIVPFPDVLTLVTGQKVSIVALKTRQLIRLVRILTHSLGPIIENGLDPEAEEFTSQLVGALITAIPEAEDEVIDFVGSMVEPVGLRKGRGLSRVDKDYNEELWTKAAEALDNPDIDDLITIVEAIIRTCAPNLKALGKRVMTLLPMEMQSQTKK